MLVSVIKRQDDDHDGVIALGNHELHQATARGRARFGGSSGAVEELLLVDTRCGRNGILFRTDEGGESGQHGDCVMCATL